MQQYDLVVVGAGIVGLATAREILQRHPEIRLAVLEKEATVASHQSGHNSGVIHTGIYYAPGSLKARLCVEGRRLLEDFCDQRGILYRRLGKLIVATAEDELARLDELFGRGRANGVDGLSMVESSEIPGIEPEARGVSAIYSPNTAVVDYGDVARAFAAEIETAGGRIRVGTRVHGLRQRDGGWQIDSNREPVWTHSLISCAGLYSDVLARMTGAARDPQIVPFRGDYWTVRPGRESLVRGLIYPVPNPAFPFLGVHFTRRIKGDLWLGPNAVLAFAREGYRASVVRPSEIASMLRGPGLYRLALRYWRTGVAEMYRAISRRALHAELQRYVAAIRLDDIRSGSAGVRAQALARDGSLVDDFVFAQEEGVLHVRNAPSPAATSSLAIARKIADQWATGDRPQG